MVCEKVGERVGQGKGGCDGERGDRVKGEIEERESKKRERGERVKGEEEGREKVETK
jgi:hypothetical protein